MKKILITLFICLIMCSCTPREYKSVLIYSTLKPEGIKYDTVYVDGWIKYYSITQHQGNHVLMLGMPPDKLYINSKYPMSVESLVIKTKKTINIKRNL